MQYTAVIFIMDRVHQHNNKIIVIPSTCNVIIANYVTDCECISNFYRLIIANCFIGRKGGGGSVETLEHPLNPPLH